jgi:alcohol dehydrogenase class IV
VITDPAEKFKFGVGGPRSVPDLALVDPDLMRSMPAFLSAATGMDALSHCIEAFVSTNQHPILDPLILHGIALIARNLPIAVARGDNGEARQAMAQAALIGGMAISSKWLGACHSLAHQLSGFANVQHGLANSIMLPHQMRYSLPGAIEQYAAVAAALGVPQVGSTRQRAEAAADAVAQLAQDVGLPARLRDVGVDEALIPEMARYAYTVDLNWWTNPRTVSEAALAGIYRAAW